MSQKWGKLPAVFLVLGSAASAPGMALAADPAAPSPAAAEAGTKKTASAPPPVAANSENIVVTGLSRRQKLQNAPVTASVFTAKNIQDSRIQNVSDFLSQVPNVSIVEAQQAGVSFLTIRGISQVRNGQSPVATIVDGVQNMDSRQFVQDLYNVDQIEVLEGPQGDLWGRNAIGGAVVINTKDPTNDLHAFADGQIGNGKDVRYKLGVSGPFIKDKLFYDINYSQRNFAGLLENVYLNKPVDYFNEYSARAHVKAILSEDLTVDLRAGIDEVLGGSNNYDLEGAKFAAPNSCFLDLADPFGNLPNNDANIVKRTFCDAHLGRNTRDVRDASIRVNYTQPWFTVTNTLAWLKLTEYLADTQDPYTASVNVDGYNGTTSQWFTETSWEDELRVSSPSQYRLRAMLGGYFLDQRDFFSSATGTDEGFGIANISTAPLFNYAKNPTTVFLGNSDHNQDFAVFAHVSYDILRNLTAEAGYRSDWNYENQYVDPLSTAGVPQGCEVSNGHFCRRAAAFQQGQPKATLTYRALPNLTFYTDYGVGFRSGQFNQSGAASEAHLSGVFDVVKPERANTFEAGFKSELLDGKLRLNGSVYDTQDEGSFYFLFVGAVGAQVLVNINQIRLVGGELQADYRPLTGLDLFGSGGYTHSRIASYAFNPSDVGNKAPYVPDFTGDIGAQYRTPIDETVGLFGRADMEIHGKQYWDPENSTARNAFQLYNLKAGIESLNGRWTALLYVNNLLDKKYNAEYVDGGFITPAEPRMFGCEFRVNY